MMAECSLMVYFCAFLKERIIYMDVHPLKLAREARGWSQARLAETLGVSSRTVTRWELNQAFPYPYYREKLCVLFEKSAEELGLLPHKETSTTEVQPPEATISQVTAADPAFPLLYDPVIPRMLGRTTQLVGRTSLLATLKARLLSGESLALTALKGLPGVGKTALVTALAMDRQVQEHFHDGILWASLGQHPNILNLLARWGALLGVLPPEGKQSASLTDWQQALCTVIGKRRMLLVLDDAWELETAAMMQVGGQHCGYLLTTRLPLVAFGFAQQGTISVPELEEEDGLALLRRAVPELVAQEPEPARLLVREAGGLPLAIMLLGNTLAAQAITGQPRRVQTTLLRLQEAEHRLRVSMPVAPGTRPTDLPPGASLSLQASIEISVQRLSHQAHITLRALAIFPPKPDSFLEAAAIAVSQEGESALDELWDAGLLESSGSERYSLHQTIADYARLQGIPPETPGRLVGFVREYTQEHAQDYEALELELSTILVGLEAAHTQGMSQDLIAGIRTLVPFLRVRGRYVLAEHYLRLAYEAAVAQADPLSQLRLLEHLAYFAELRAEYQQAESYGEQGLVLARAHRQREIESALLTTLGQVAANRGEYTQALEYFEQALTLARLVGDGQRVCTLLSLLIWIANLQGRYTQALEMAQEGLQLARRLKDWESLIRLLDFMGQIASRQREYAQGEAYYLEGLELARQLGYRERMSWLLNNLACLLQERGDDTQAEAYYLEGLELTRQIGHRGGLCLIYLANLGNVALSRGKYVEAERYLSEVVEQARRLDRRDMLPFVLANLGEAAGCQGDYEQANRYFEESVELARQQNAIWVLSNVLASWGSTHLHCQQLDEAGLAYQEVLALEASAEVDPEVAASVRYGLARVAAQRGEVSQARSLGEESLAILERVNQRKAAEVNDWLRTLVMPGEEVSSANKSM